VPARQKVCQCGSPHARTINCSVRLGKDPEGVVRYLTLLKLLHSNCVAGRLVSQRDLYYSAPGLFSDQAQCNRDIQSLCKAVGVPRLSLNVYASSRGNVVSDCLTRSNVCRTVECMHDCAAHDCCSLLLAPAGARGCF
jgi:DNA topoisomerase VI subunit A